MGKQERTRRAQEENCRLILAAIKADGSTRKEIIKRLWEQNVPRSVVIRGLSELVVKQRKLIRHRGRYCLNASELSTTSPTPTASSALAQIPPTPTLEPAPTRQRRAHKRPTPLPASRSEAAAVLLGDAIGNRQRLAELRGFDRVRIAHEHYIAELEAQIDHLKRLAFEPQPDPDAGRATDKDMHLRSGYRKRR